MKGYYILKNKHSIFKDCKLYITSFFDVTMRLLFICQSICFNSTLEYVNDISNHVFCENEILIYTWKEKKDIFYVV